MNILSEPLVKYVVSFNFLIFFCSESWSPIYIKKLWFSIYPESCSSSLHVVITAYNELKSKFNLIKYKFISKCKIFRILCFSVKDYFPIYLISEDKKKTSKKILSRSNYYYLFFYSLQFTACYSLMDNIDYMQISKSSKQLSF